MNELNITVKNGIGYINMIVSQDMLDNFIDLFDMELDILEGTSEITKDGLYNCVFKLSGYKLDMMQDFIRELARHPKMEVTIMGVKINNN